jgi:hypothetical protein
MMAGTEMSIESYLPERSLSPEERSRADELDAYLAVEVPNLEASVAKGVGDDESLVRKWYLLGEGLRRIIDVSGLVLSADVDSGDLWKAVWWYLPRGLRPAGSGGEEVTYDVGHKRKDHLSLCYEISALPWSSVRWIQRWDDWHQISFRPTISRDRRLLSQLGSSIGEAGRYPTRPEFREMAKRLGERFPTRRLVNTEVLGDEEIAAQVEQVVKKVMQAERT